MYDITTPVDGVLPASLGLLWTGLLLLTAVRALPLPPSCNGSSAAHGAGAQQASPPHEY